MAQDDRRRAPRADIALTAMVLARHNDGIAFTIDSISTSGARLAGPLTLDVGERVQIMFEIDGRPVDVHAEVVRREPRDITMDNIAVRFTDLTDDARAAIHAAVLKRLEQY